jgi:hypothetical protein
MQIAGEKTRLQHLQSALSDMQGTREEATVRRTEAELLRQARLTAMETDCAASVQRIQEQHAQVQQYTYARITSVLLSNSEYSCISTMHYVDTYWIVQAAAVHIDCVGE